MQLFVLDGAKTKIFLGVATMFAFTHIDVDVRVPFAVATIDSESSKVGELSPATGTVVGASSWNIDIATIMLPLHIRVALIIRTGVDLIDTDIAGSYILGKAGVRVGIVGADKLRGSVSVDLVGE